MNTSNLDLTVLNNDLVNLKKDYTALMQERREISEIMFKEKELFNGTTNKTRGLMIKNTNKIKKIMDEIQEIENIKCLLRKGNNGKDRTIL